MPAATSTGTVEWDASTDGVSYKGSGTMSIVAMALFFLLILAIAFMKFGLKPLLAYMERRKTRRRAKKTRKR